MKIGVMFRKRSQYLGGGEMYVDGIIRALGELGHQVILNEEFDGFGKYGLYRSLSFRPLKELRKECDLVIDAYGISPWMKADFVCLHTPPTSEMLAEKYGSLLGKAYWKIFKWAAGTPKGIILADSRFSQSIIKESYNKDAIILYPPVDTWTYRPLSSNEDRKDWVLVISRIAEEKNLTEIPLLASKTPKNIQFHLVGNTPFAELSQLEIEKIRATAKSLGVWDRIHLHINISQKEKQALMRESKVLLQTSYAHFGISTVEGMSAGLIPITPDSSGHRDIVPNEWRTNDLETKADLITVAIYLGWSSEYAREMSDLAERFNFEEFKVHLKAIIHK